MLSDIVNDPKFKTAFSVILGFAIATLFRPLCVSQGGTAQCRDYKAPDVKEMTDHVYRIGAKCYSFKSHVVDCGNKAQVIEAFW
jgi:hypothetical protein